MTPQIMGFLLALGAGLCTTIGGSCVFFVRGFNRLHLAACMALSAGVMGYVSFIEIFPEALEGITTGLEKRKTMSADGCKNLSYLITTICFFAGWLLASLVDFVIDKLIGMCGLGRTASDSNHNTTTDNETPDSRRPELIASPFVEITKEEVMNGSVSPPIERRVSESATYPKKNSVSVGTMEIDYENPESRMNNNRAVPDTGSAAVVRTASNVASCCQKMPSWLRWFDNSSTNRSDSRIWEMQQADESFRRDYKRFLKMGITTAVALSLHNLPEGIATFSGALASSKGGFSIAIAIGIHNIPEGFAVSVPLYFGTGNKWKSFAYSILTGLAEPCGALVAWLALGGTKDTLVLGVALGVICGIMTNIAMIELFPGAIKYDPLDQVTSKFFLAGMLIMALSLVLLGV